MQGDMVAWQSGYQDTEREYQNMNETLLQEVPLPTPAVRTGGAENPPIVSIPPVNTSQFTVPPTVNVPQSSGQSSRQVAGQYVDEDIQAKWAKVSTLRKSYPGAPPLVNWGSQGFNVTALVTQDPQAKIPQFFNFIGSNTGTIHAATEIPITRSADSLTKEKPPPDSVPV